MHTRTHRARFHQRAPRWRQVLTVAATALALVCASAPADAHTPVLLGPDDTAQTLDTSPLAPTGTTSFAFYTRTDAVGDTRAVRIQMAQGQPFHAQLLIPELTPETALPASQLPRLSIISPDGQLTTLDNTGRTPFFEPFTQTSYLTLTDTAAPAQPGTYALIVTGAAPARFVIATGDDEQFDAPLVGATIATTTDVQNWYRTPPTPGTGYNTTPTNHDQTQRHREPHHPPVRHSPRKDFTPHRRRKGPSAPLDLPTAFHAKPNFVSGEQGERARTSGEPAP
ncbi:hypothetical protein [Rhodococcus sp. ACS1]|uniref:hypothetical protein n=1 Tax=Rhodococcus sp. ACS1 TaxID=2028570 RepID=UPI00117AB831|nr:hypothetical protein [Rhodococcus sp. ACS1]